MARTSGLIRPSKLRLPERTATATRSCSWIASLIGRGKRARVADAGRAAVADQVEAKLVEVCVEPRVVKVVGDDLRARVPGWPSPRAWSCSPFSTAFLASRPAATITDGFEVLVQLVIAAITTEPCVIGAGVTGIGCDLGLGDADRRTPPFGGEPLDHRQGRGRRLSCWAAPTAAL